MLVPQVLILLPATTWRDLPLGEIIPLQNWPSFVLPLVKLDAL